MKFIDVAAAANLLLALTFHSALAELTARVIRDPQCSAIGSFPGNPVTQADVHQFAADVKNGSWSSIRSDIWSGMDPETLKGTKWYKDALQTRKDALLISAAARDDIAVEKILLRGGANIEANGEVDDWMTPLITAARCNSTSSVRFLLHLGAKPNHATSYSLDENSVVEGTTALIWAAANNDFLTTSALIAAGANPNVQETVLTADSNAPAPKKMGRTPLLATGSVDITAILLRKAADPNTADWTGSTPLTRAAASGNQRIYRLLLEYGARVTAH